MPAIDQLSYNSPFRQISPKLKASYSFFLIIVCLLTEIPIIHISVLLINTFVLMIKSELSFKRYISLIGLPFGFIILSIISIVIQISSSEIILPVFVYKIFGISIGATKESLLQGLIVFTRSLAALSSSYFLMLTTPMVDIIRLLKTLKIPKEVIEIMVLTYKFIFILLKESKRIYESQWVRMGYTQLKSSYRSLAILLKMIFLSTIKRYQKMQDTLEIRQFKGEFYL